MNIKNMQREVDNHSKRLCSEYCKYYKKSDELCKGCPLKSILRTIDPNGVYEITKKEIWIEVETLTRLSKTDFLMLKKYNHSSKFHPALDIFFEDIKLRNSFNIIDVLNRYLCSIIDGNGIDEKAFIKTLKAAAFQYQKMHNINEENRDT